MTQNNISSSSCVSARHIDNVIPLRQKILPYHRMALLQWLEASYAMGILDVDIAPLSCHNSLPDGPEQIIIWQRENAQPAYIIQPIGTYWLLTDSLNGKEIGHFSHFNTVLETICPVHYAATRQRASL